MHFNLDSLHPLLGMMPAVMRAHELEAYEPGIPALLEAMAREVTMERVGAGGILARQWLTRERMRISVVAKRLGYDSEASFSRAFKRVIGAPPSRFRTGDADPG